MKMVPRPVTIVMVYWFPLVKVNAEPWRVHCEQLEPMLNVVVVTLFGASDGPFECGGPRRYVFRVIR